MTPILTAYQEQDHARIGLRPINAHSIDYYHYVARFVMRDSNDAQVCWVRASGGNDFGAHVIGIGTVS